jgi:uncharacterized membrane protein YgaE (UPF0421/DUF939 family)
MLKQILHPILKPAYNKIKKVIDREIVENNNILELKFISKSNENDLYEQINNLNKQINYQNDDISYLRNKVKYHQNEKIRVIFLFQMASFWPS